MKKLIYTLLLGGLFYSVGGGHAGAVQTQRDTIFTSINGLSLSLVGDTAYTIWTDTIGAVRADSTVALSEDSLSVLYESLEPVDSLPENPKMKTLVQQRRDAYCSDSLLQDSLMKVEKMKKSYIPHPCVWKFNLYVRNFHREYKELLDRWDDIYLPAAPAWIRSDADYYKLIIPTTYYSDPIEEAFSISDWKPVIPFVKEDPIEKLLPPLPQLTKSKKIDQYINRQLLSFYLDYPNMVRKNERDLKGVEPLGDKYKIKRPNKEKVFYLSRTPMQVQQVDENELLVVKPNFWTMGGNGYVQFSQNFISKNWYKGGESTKSLLSGLVWQINYNDQQKVQFENRIEWKLGFIATPSDTVHQYKPNNDLFRISSKLGYKAIWNWYYTLSAEFKTQFASSYETNSENLVSTFFSPAELNVGLGMDYKYVKDGVCNLSVLVNPFNYTRYSIASDRVDPTKFNIDAGCKSKNQLGSRLEATVSWIIIKNLLWESRFSYTTNYEKVLSEWENTFTFTFNKYFSTKLFVHTRFDDSVVRDPDKSYFQLQELLSLGFNYTW